jgi:hypothetical protein
MLSTYQDIGVVGIGVRLGGRSLVSVISVKAGATYSIKRKYAEERHRKKNETQKEKGA